MSEALIIGAGPAGLMAAEELAQAGVSVLVAEAKPSVGRKFLMAGKSGLNLTMDQPFETFLAAYGADAGALRPMLEAFGPDQVKDWAGGLGQELFTGSTGRVFPKAMKASPLLRAWLARLNGMGVEFATSWRWQGWEGSGFAFDTPEGRRVMRPEVAVLACGGVSWARLGSDGAWAQYLGTHVAPFQPANMGFNVPWSGHMKRHFGSPVKGVELRAGACVSRGEIVISKDGIEGGGIYAVSRAMRMGAALEIDLMPDVAEAQLWARLARPRGKMSLGNYLRKTLKLDAVKLALLQEFGRPLPDDLTGVIKRLPIRHEGPQAMDRAISTAGGLGFGALDAGLMLQHRPGVFAAGEMLDWEAPTGGYLITACLATGRWAGRAAAAYQGKSAAR